MSDTNISSRTPEGLPNRCPLCGAAVLLEPSAFFGDAPCPSCGQLLWFYRSASGVRFFDHNAAAPLREQALNFLAEQLGVAPENVSLDVDTLDRLELDSLEVAELIMDLEDEFGFDFGDEDWPPK